MKGNKSCARKGSNGPEEESSKQKRTMKKLAIRERENESVKGMKKIVNGDVENQVCAIIIIAKVLIFIIHSLG